MGAPAIGSALTARSQRPSSASPSRSPPGSLPRATPFRLEERRPDGHLPNDRGSAPNPEREPPHRFRSGEVVRRRSGDLAKRLSSRLPLRPAPLLAPRAAPGGDDPAAPEAAPEVDIRRPRPHPGARSPHRGSRTTPLVEGRTTPAGLPNSQRGWLSPSEDGDADRAAGETVRPLRHAPRYELRDSRPGDSNPPLDQLILRRPAETHHRDCRRGRGRTREKTGAPRPKTGRTGRDGMRRPRRNAESALVAPPVRYTWADDPRTGTHPGSRSPHIHGADAQVVVKPTVGIRGVRKPEPDIEIRGCR